MPKGCSFPACIFQSITPGHCTVLDLNLIHLRHDPKLSSAKQQDRGTPHAACAADRRATRAFLSRRPSARSCGAGHLRTFTTRVAHVLPVSDDGGSTAEIVRVLGGPAVGDIRSRCLRLADDRDAEARAHPWLRLDRWVRESPAWLSLEFKLLLA